MIPISFLFGKKYLIITIWSSILRDILCRCNSKLFVSFQITSFSAMIENPSYHHLLRLFADDNDIESLLELEGTDFIQNFDSFHLRRNKLKTVS